MRKTKLTLLVVLTIFTIILHSCYPGEDFTYEDTDIVATFYDDAADFSVLKTFALLDSVIHIGDSSLTPGDVNRTYDRQILSSIEENMISMGYTETADQNTADVHMVALVTTTTFVSGGCYYSYWSYWYPYYGWCYPAYYTYTTGTVLILMAHPDKSGDDKSVWIAGLNGVLSGTTSNTSTRLNTNIDQSFSQSPYLGDGK